MMYLNQSFLAVVFAAHVSLAFPVMLSMAVFAYAEVNTVLSEC